MKYIYISIIILTIIITPFTAYSEHWADIPLKYMTDNGYISEGKPDEAVTRLEVAQVLAKLNLINKGSNYIFSDTSDKAVVKVAKAGLMNGIGNQRFAPDDYITREEIAKTVALLIENPQSYSDMPFADQNSISDWARPYITALVRDKIVFGCLSVVDCVYNIKSISGIVTESF